MAWGFVDFQASVTQSAGGTNLNASHIDCSGLQVDDLVVIGHAFRVTGGGNNWTNKFSGSGTEYDHVAGPFVRSSLFIGGPSLDSRATNDQNLCILTFYTHVIVSTDLTDLDGQGTLQRFGWHSTAPYSSALAMWTLRGVPAYSSESSVTYDTDQSGALTPNTNLLSVGQPTRLQQVFGMAWASNQAVAGGPFGSTTVSNKDASGQWEHLIPTPTQWTSGGNYVNASFEALNSPNQADASNVQFTHTLANNAIAAGNGAMSGLLMKVTFADDVGPPLPTGSNYVAVHARKVDPGVPPYRLHNRMLGDEQ